ncbi:uncharacterized protein [Antedon mediterranea]
MSMDSSPGAPMAASTVMKTHKYQEYLDDDARGSFYGQQQLSSNPKQYNHNPSQFYQDNPSTDSIEQSKKKLKTKGLLDSLDSNSSSDIDNFLKTHNLSDMLEKMPSSNLSLSIQTDLGRGSLGRESIGLNNTGSSLGILSIDSMHDLSGSLLQIGSPIKSSHGDLKERPELDTTLTPDTPLSAFSNEGDPQHFDKFEFFDTVGHSIDNNTIGNCKEHHSPNDVAGDCVDCMIKSNKSRPPDLLQSRDVDFDSKQVNNNRSHFSIVGAKRESDHSQTKDIQNNSMQHKYSGSARKFPLEKLDSMFFEHSPMANIPRPGSGDGEEIFPPRLPSQGQEQNSKDVNLPNQTTNSVSLQNTGSEFNLTGSSLGSSLPFKPSQKSPPLGARRPSEGSEGSWQDAALTRQKKFTKTNHSVRKSGIPERLSQGVRGRAIGSESLDSSEIDTEDELDAVRKELEERNNYIEPAERECVGESEDSSNEGRPGLEGGSSDENNTQYAFNGIRGPRESAEGEVIAPVLGDGGGGGDGMSDGEDGNVPPATSQLTTMDFFHGINAGSHDQFNGSDQRKREIEGQSVYQDQARGQPVGKGMISTPYRQVRFASKDEVNTLSRLDSDSDYSRGRPSVSSDTSRGNDTEMPSMFFNPNKHHNDTSTLYASANPLQASSIRFEDESIFDGDCKERLEAQFQPKRNNPFDQESTSPGQAFIGRSSLGDFGNDITFSQKFSFGDDEFSHMEVSARSSGSDHSSTRSSNASRRLTGNSCQGSQNGDDHRASVYLDDDGQVVNDLAFRNSLPIIKQANGMASISFEDFISGEDVGVGDHEFVGGGCAEEMIDEAEKSFEKENIFRQDEHISPTEPNTNQFDWSTGGVENILDRYNDITGTEDFCRISIGRFMEGRTEALGSLSGNGNTNRPEFGGGIVVSPSSGLPRALYENHDGLNETSLQEAASINEPSTWIDDPNYTMSGFTGVSRNDNTYNVTANSASRTLTNETQNQTANDDSGLDYSTNGVTPLTDKSHKLDTTEAPAINMSTIASAIINASSSTKPNELAAMILALSNKPTETTNEKTSDKCEETSNRLEHTRNNLENENQPCDIKDSNFENSSQVGNIFEKSSKVKQVDYKREEDRKQVKQRPLMEGNQVPKSDKSRTSSVENSKRNSRSSDGEVKYRQSDHQKQFNPTRPRRIGDGVEDSKTSKSRFSTKPQENVVKSLQGHATQYVAPYSVKKNLTKQNVQEHSRTSNLDKQARDVSSSAIKSKNSISDTGARNKDDRPLQSGGRYQRKESQGPDGRRLDSSEPKPMVGQVDPIQSTGKSSETVEDMEKSDAMIVEMLRKARRAKGSQARTSQRHDENPKRPQLKVDGQRISNSSHRSDGKDDSRNIQESIASHKSYPPIFDPILKHSIVGHSSKSALPARNVSKIDQDVSEHQFNTHSQIELHANMRRTKGVKTYNSNNDDMNKIPLRPEKQQYSESIENKERDIKDYQKEAPNIESMKKNTSDRTKFAEKKSKRSSPSKGRRSIKPPDSDVFILGDHRIVASEYMPRPSDIMIEDSFFDITQSQPNTDEGSPEHEDIKFVTDSDKVKPSRQKVHVSPSQKSKTSLSPVSQGRLSQDSTKSSSPRTHRKPSQNSKMSISLDNHGRIYQESSISLSPRSHETGIDSAKLQHLYSSSVSQSSLHNRHLLEEHPHHHHLGNTVSISDDKRYIPPQLPHSSSQVLTDHLPSFANLPISSFQPIPGILPPSGKPTLLTSQSLLTNAIASQYLNDRPIMTTCTPSTSSSSNQFFGHGSIPSQGGLHSTYSYGTIPAAAPGTHFLPTSTANGRPGPFMSTLPSGSTLPHFHGQSALPHASIVANLVVPKQLRFQGVCCVGIAAQATLPLHNPSTRWLQCTLEVVSVSINGEEVNPISKPSFLIHPKTIISPHTTEEVKIIFMPKYPGIYISEVQITSSPVVANSETALVQVNPPQVVTIQGLAEKPSVEIQESDDGSIHFGNINQNTSTSKRILVVNRGRATVPIRIALISGSLMHHLSFSVGEKSNTGVSTKPVHTTLAGNENQTKESPSVSVWVHIKASSKLSITSNIKLGPPDVISGQLQVEFDTPEQHEYLAVLPIKGLVGVARLHASRSMQAMNFKSTVGQYASRNFPLKNAGNLRLDIQLSVVRAKDLFTMVPEKLALEPDEERDVLVKYRPKEAPSEVESTLVVQVLPDGPHYEVVMLGKATTTSPISKEPSMLPILCTKQFVVWGGVPVGRALQQKIVLKNDSDSQMMKLKLSIKGNTDDFQLQSSFGQQEKLTDNRHVVLKPSEQIPVHILFAPTSENTMKATLVIRPTTGNTKFTIPLSGYGGVSNIILSGLTHVGDTYLSNVMNVVAGQTRTLSFEALNTGSRTAFVKIIPFADLKASEKLESKRITIKPDEFILQREKLQKITLTLHLTKTDSVLCSKQSHLLCAIGIFYGDEITRHQYRQAQKTGTAKKVVLSGSNPLKEVVFDKPFLNEEKVEEKFNLSPSPNDKQLFYSCMSRIMVSFIGASKEVNDSIQYEGDWTLKKEVDEEMPRFPKMKEMKKERWSEIMSNSPPIKDIPAPPSHKAMHSSPITSSESSTWSIQPEHLVLHVQSQSVSKGRVQVINSTDRTLSFELTWPGHCLTVTPQTGVVEPRSQILVLVSPSPSLASRGVQLPWGGSVYIKCDGNLKEIKVQIRQDIAMDTSIYPSRGHLTSLDNQPATPGDVIGVPNLQIKEPIKLKLRTVTFEETQVGKISEATVEFKSMTNEVLRWCLSSFAPAYVKQEGGDIFRATYSAFRFAKQSGSILSGQEFKVLVTFIPREVGKYSQYWNLEYEPRERMSETQSIRIEMTAVASKDGPEKPTEDAQHLKSAVVGGKADSDNPTKGKSCQDNNVKPNSGIEVEESELFFPATDINTTAMLKVAIRNRSHHNQEVKFLSPKPPFAIKHFKHVIKSQVYARLPIFFKPTHSGKYSGMVVIQTSLNEKLTIKLEGEAV